MEKTYVLLLMMLLSVISCKDKETQAETKEIVEVVKTEVVETSEVIESEELKNVQKFITNGVDVEAKYKYGNKWNWRKWMGIFTVDNILTLINIFITSILSIILLCTTIYQNKKLNQVQILQQKQNEISQKQNTILRIVENRIIPLCEQLNSAIEKITNKIEQGQSLANMGVEYIELMKSVDTLGKSINNIHLSVNDFQIHKRYTEINSQLNTLLTIYGTQNFNLEQKNDIINYLNSISLYYENMLQFFYAINNPILPFLDEDKYWQPLLINYQKIK